MKGNVTTSYWFDEWTRQAKRRTARRQKVEAIITAITGALIILGLMMTLIGVMWIDSMDVCAANVVMSFAGVVITFIGTYTRFLWEVGA